MKIRICAYAFFFISSHLFAADNNYQNATPFVKQQINSAAQETKNVTPRNETPGFTTSNPEQASYYGGGTAVSTNIQEVGANKLNNSSVGQQVAATNQNNVTTINKDAAYIKAGTNAQNNASIMTARENQTCPQAYYKSSDFQTHICNKTFDTYDFCTKISSINGSYHMESEEKTQSFIPSITDTTSYWFEAAEHGSKIRHEIPGSKINFNAEFSGKIKKIEIYRLKTDFIRPGHSLEVKASFDGVSKEQTFLTPCHRQTDDGCTNERHRYDYNESFSNLNKSVSAGQSLDIRFNQVLLAELRVCLLRSNNDNNLCRRWVEVQDKPSVVVTYEIPKKVYDINVTWQEVCPFNRAGHQLVESTCTESGGVKNYFYDGKVFNVRQDCWAYANKYKITTASEGTCAQYSSNPDCLLSKSYGCSAYYNGQCSSGKYQYQCQTVSNAASMQCGMQYYCQDGTCSDSAVAGDPQFAQSASALAALNAAASDISGDSVNMKAFTGRALQCRTSFGGFNNCCKDSGWGQDAGLASCNSTEKEIGTAKSKTLTVKLGTKCTNKVLGVCLKKAEVYCVFDNKLARIMQTQGRRDQLGIGFGSAGSPNCRGITIDELSRIKFNEVDFSDFQNDLNGSVSVPANLNIGETIRQRVSQMVSQGSN